MRYTLPVTDVDVVDVIALAEWCPATSSFLVALMMLLKLKDYRAVRHCEDAFAENRTFLDTSSRLLSGRAISIQYC
jgi:hypothetical protein